MYRLYVDEVGNDDLSHVDDDRHRYLSLTGVAMKIDHARDQLNVKLNSLKANVFAHDPDSPLILHRKEILHRKGVYQCLNEVEKLSVFNEAILDIFCNTEYVVITALVDKAWMREQAHWEQKHPYHYLMEILVEKYAQFLERRNAIGDIMPESRQAKKDKLLQKVYELTRENGCNFVNARRMQSVFRSSNLKFRTKKDNIAGLQLCDLIAHPSHIYVRHIMEHDVNLRAFAEQVINILNRDKYDRAPTSGKIIGYGIKYLP